MTTRPKSHHDLADIFRIVTTRGEKLGKDWHRLGEVDATEGTATRRIETFEGSVAESKLTPHAGLSYEGDMNAEKLRALAAQLRQMPKAA